MSHTIGVRWSKPDGSKPGVQTRGPNPEGPRKIKIRRGLKTNDRRRSCGGLARAGCCVDAGRYYGAASI